MQSQRCACSCSAHPRLPQPAAGEGLSRQARGPGVSSSTSPFLMPRSLTWTCRAAAGRGSPRRASPHPRWKFEKIRAPVLSTTCSPGLDLWTRMCGTVLGRAGGVLSATVGLHTPRRVCPNPPLGVARLWATPRPCSILQPESCKVSTTILCKFRLNLYCVLPSFVPTSFEDERRRLVVERRGGH